MQPWRTPVVTWNHPLISYIFGALVVTLAMLLRLINRRFIIIIIPFILIALQQSVYRLHITSTSIFGSPHHSRIFHNASLLMLSNALRKWTKFTITGLWPSDTFSMICRREIWSIQDCRGLQPACCWRNSWSTVFCIRFSNTLANTLRGISKSVIPRQLLQSVRSHSSEMTYIVLSGALNSTHYYYFSSSQEI